MSIGKILDYNTRKMTIFINKETDVTYLRFGGFFHKTTNKSESDCLARPTVSSDVLYINCTHTRLAYMCTVYSIL